MADFQREPEGGRTAYWDNIKGILIFFVVFGHFLWSYLGFGAAGTVLSVIYIFHMPAFIVVSGFLSKSEHSRSKQSLVKLAVIYAVFNTIMMIVSALLFESSYQLLTPYFSYWFLLSLIVWRTTIKYIPESKLFILCCVIIAILVGWWKDVTNILAISRTIVFFPFFYIGYRLPTEKIQKFIHNRKPKYYLAGFVILAYTLLLSLFFIYKYPWLKHSDFLMDSYGSLTDMVVRIVLICLAGLYIAGMFLIIPAKPIPLLNKWGRNSLSVYVLHRFFTFFFIKIFPAATYSNQYLFPALGAALLITFLLGSDRAAGIFYWLVDKASSFFTGQDKDGSKPVKPFRVTAVVSLVILCLLLPLFSLRKPVIKPDSQEAAVNLPTLEEPIHTVMTREQASSIQNAVSIAFVGDLILLQDQVRNAYDTTTGKYDFNPMFEYAKKYLSQADFSIGIFEGPAAGEDAGYTTSNYDDGIPLYLNFPDDFAMAVKDSGIDLVSTANNHLLDKGEEGAMRTLDILDQIGLMHIGSWRSQEEKAKIPVIEVEGIRIALLAYTYGSNYYTERYFLDENPSLTSILTDPSSTNFEKVKSAVLADFQSIRAMDNPPDLIAVIPHMGTQFSHDTDNYQDTWNNIFVEAGADIILGDHAHAVQPIEFRSIPGNNAGKYAVIVNCPGNFANSYIEQDGDATAIVEIYLDPKTKQVVCAGVIPMYTQARSDGNYRALPVYSILNDPLLQQEISRYEIKRVAEVYGVVTKVMLKAPLTLDQVQERHYLFPEGYMRQAVVPIVITDSMKNNQFYKLLIESNSVCFVGDSLTEGTKNGGFGWFEPMMAAFPEHTVYKRAWGGATTQTLLDNVDAVTECPADIFVIAVGTNDVRYRDEKICAMDKESYVASINTLITQIKKKNPEAKIVFIAPWLALENDPYTKIPVQERDFLLGEYANALKDYCDKNNYLFINPNPAIAVVLSRYAPSDYILDHIHPNAGCGIALYSEAVLLNSAEEPKD